MAVTIRTGDFDAFFEAPFSAYGPDSAYVSPLKSDLRRFIDTRQNPLFHGDSDLAFFTAHRDGTVAGRITAHVHTASNTLHGWSRGYFGYFDCVNDQAVAFALLSAAEAWVRGRGLTEIVGNFNLTAMQQIGIVTEGFENPPYTDLVWNPPHIPVLLAACGYTPEFGMTTFEVDLQTTALPQIGTVAQAVLDDPDYTFAPIKRRQMSLRMEEARRILNASFARNPMFVPVSESEFRFQARDMAWIIDPRISAMLHHRGRPAGVILCVPDLNPFLHRVRSRMGLTAPWHFVRHKLTGDRAVLIFSGVDPDYQGQGIGTVLLHRVLSEMKRAGYRKMGNTWVADVNPASLRQKEKSGARPLHRVHLFGKVLQ